VTHRLPLCLSALSTFPFHCWLVISLPANLPKESGMREACCADRSSSFLFPFHCWRCFRTSRIINFIPVMRDSGVYMSLSDTHRQHPFHCWILEKQPLFPVLVIPGLGLKHKGFRNILDRFMLGTGISQFVKNCPTPGPQRLKPLRNVGNLTPPQGLKRCVSDRNRSFRRPCVGRITCSAGGRKRVPERELTIFNQNNPGMPELSKTPGYSPRGEH